MDQHATADQLANVITHDIFGNRFRGFDSVRGWILPFSYLQAVTCVSKQSNLMCLLQTRRYISCYAASSPICWHVDFAGADNSPFDTRWPRVSGGCSKSLEFAALSCQGHAFLARLPPWTQESRLYCLGCCTLSIDSFSTVSWHWHCKVVPQQ